MFFSSLKLVLEHSLERTVTLASLFLEKFAWLAFTQVYKDIMVLDVEG